jgi:hypothetical protein
MIPDMFGGSGWLSRGFFWDGFGGTNLEWQEDREW